MVISQKIFFPVKARIHPFYLILHSWIPTFVGMTEGGNSQ